MNGLIIEGDWKPNTNELYGVHLFGNQVKSVQKYVNSKIPRK
jgi:hypothetical protein